jgi:linoleoyl-CoA desaturase
LGNYYRFSTNETLFKRNLSYGEFKKPVIRWTTLVITKVIYFSMWIVIPILIGTRFLVASFNGIFGNALHSWINLSVVFQLAHVVEETDNPIPNDEGEIENTWAVHQLYTTANFAPKNWLVNYYTGGLNHQIEHHLFPNISHIHYNKIAEFVKETAKECNLTIL